MLWCKMTNNEATEAPMKNNVSKEEIIEEQLNSDLKVSRGLVKKDFKSEWQNILNIV